MQAELLALILGDLDVGAGGGCSPRAAILSMIRRGLRRWQCHLLLVGLRGVLEAGGANGTADLRHPATLSSENSSKSSAETLRFSSTTAVSELRGLHFADFFHGAVLFRLTGCCWHCIGSNLSRSVRRDGNQT